MSDLPHLILLGSGEHSGASRGRVSAKLLAASLLRNVPLGEVRAIRPEPALQSGPLFRVERAGLVEVPVSLEPPPPPEPEHEHTHEHEHETGCCCCSHHPAPEPVPDYFPWTARDAVEEDEAASLSWILHLGSGTLIRRGIDHLLAGRSDLLWAPLPGIPVHSTRSGVLLSPAERQPDHRPEHPVSRPWRQAASASIWAVRGPHFHRILNEWEVLAGEAASVCGTAVTPVCVESAWNRLLLDTSLRVERFESGEIQFPSLPEADYLRWKEAAVLHCGLEWPEEARAAFLQAWFFGTYFGDRSGLFLDIVEP